MTKLIPYCFLVVVLSYNCAAQNISKQFLMQGIWENVMNKADEKAYSIIRGHNALSFVFDPRSEALDFPLSESLKGFQDADNGNEDSIHVSSLKSDGKYYTIIQKADIDKDGWVQRPGYLTAGYFECDGNFMSINGGAQLVEYSKLDELPFDALERLYNRSKLDHRNYIGEYIGLNVKEIGVDNVNILFQRDRPTGDMLMKGDIIIIYGEQGEMHEVSLARNKKIRGWIKSNAINDWEY